MKSDSGFTLIEVMVVVVILGLLATIVIANVVHQVEKAKLTRAKLDIENFKAALHAFKQDNGFYPSTQQTLEALIKKPEIGRIPANWQEGGYLKTDAIPPDPWGFPYIYISPGIHSQDFDIMSLGSDNMEGGTGNAGDIVSWTMEE